MAKYKVFDLIYRQSKNKKLKSVLIEVEKIEKKEVMAFFKPFMKVLNLEKIV